MKLKYDSYEIEIIISLGFLILFLISINFVSGYSFERARAVQVSESERSLNLATEYARVVFEGKVGRLGYSDNALRDYLREVAFMTGIDDIAIIDTLGNEVASVSNKASSEGRLEVAKRPLAGKDGNIIGYVRLSTFNAAGRRLEKLAHWDTIFRFGGLVASLVMGAVFLRAILLPYRRIKGEAIDFNLDLRESGRKPGIEYVVNTFKEVIRELEEKSGEIEDLYKSSVKRADSLARYNEYILGSITSGAVICDSKGVVTRFNRSAQSILQYIEKDCRGKHYREIFGNEHQLVVLFDDALQRQMVHSRRELEIRRPDGKKLWLGCSSSLINDEHGEGMGVVVLLIDLTEIKRLQELTSYSEKMMTLGETAAGLAHEVRNSFAAIMGFANLLRKSPDRAELVEELAESIKKESLESETLMSRFLSFAKPLNLSPEPLVLAELLDSALAMLAHPGLGAIKITKNLPGDLPSFWGDRMLLRQVIHNLLLNACDALPDGGEIRIKASLEQKHERESRREIVLSITDNGVGIAPELSIKIFDPFVTGRPDGTGLGLALVKKIIVMHGGRVEARSKPGKGTRFTIYIPLETASVNIPVAEPAASIS